MPFRKHSSHFLILEDIIDEAFILQIALQKLPFPVTSAVCRNLSEVKDYLRGAGMYANRQKFPLPRIVLSDLHIGLESGLDLSTWINSKPELKDIKVIILTGSSVPEELAEVR